MGSTRKPVLTLVCKCDAHYHTWGHLTLTILFKLQTNPRESSHQRDKRKSLNRILIECAFPEVLSLRSIYREAETVTVKAEQGRKMAETRKHRHTQKHFQGANRAGHQRMISYYSVKLTAQLWTFFPLVSLFSYISYELVIHSELTEVYLFSFMVTLRKQKILCPNMPTLYIKYTIHILYKTCYVIYNKII